MRTALGFVGAATALAAHPPAAPAAPTISKAAVAYQDQPQSGKECDKCVQFVPPGSCKVVEGAISPHGSCRIFRPASQAS